MNKKQKNYRYGIIAEYISIMILIFKGYLIIKKRYKTKLGEIDIIALKNNILVFIEVKARKNLKSFSQVIRPIQRDRIDRSARIFCASNRKFQNFRIRFDLITFDGYIPRHIKNLW